MKRFIDHNSFLNFALDFEFLPAKFLNERVGTSVISLRKSKLLPHDFATFEAYWRGFCNSCPTRQSSSRNVVELKN